MTGLIIILCLVLLSVVAVQIGKVNQLTAKIRGEEETKQQRTNANGIAMLIFMVVFLIGCIASAWYYKNQMLGYGPLQSASIHGASIDFIFNITLFFTGIVFVVTQIALFWFAYKYREQIGGKAMFLSHNNRLEVIWTAIPAIVMTLLVVGGLDVWNEAMADVKDGEDFLEIEATAYQFAWAIRYPGEDNLIGTKNYKMITANNTLGQDFTDPKNWDDIQADEIVLPVNKKIRVRITARDVLHNFYLPHFKVKMDAIPGLPTYFVFTPTKTTEQFRQELKKYPEYQEPFDPADPNGPKRWEKFEYELACAELCGKGHFSMRKLVKIVTEDQYKEWLKTQKSFYLQNIRGKEEDPNKDKVLPFEVQMRSAEFSENVEKALKDSTSAGKTLRLDHVFFETGSNALKADSKYELDNLVSVLNKYPKMSIEVAGHTDNVGDPEANRTLSVNRAKAVYDYLVGKGIAGGRLHPAGYGDTKPIEKNDTEEGRAKNRRTEFKILSH